MNVGPVNEGHAWGSDAGQVGTGKPPEQRRRSGVSFAVAALMAAALGVAVGQVWRLVAPRVPIIKLERGYAYAEGQPEQAVAADGWFGLLGLIAGVLVAVLAWRLLRHRRGVVVLAALVLGSLVGGWFGWWLGVRLESAAFEARAAATPVGDRLDAPLSLRMTDLSREHPWPVEVNGDGITERVTGVIVAQALAAAFTYTVLAGFAADPDLRPSPPKGSSTDGLAGPVPARPTDSAGTTFPAGATLPPAPTFPVGSAAPTFPVGSAAPTFSAGPDVVRPDPVRPDAGPPNAGAPDAGPPNAVRPDAVRPADPAAPDPRISSAPGGPADPKGAPESP